MPLHPKAREFAKSGLFAGLSSFEELEKRIAAIPENKGKGDAFEVFAEAYLATQRKHDAHQVWPLNATPLDVLGKLGLGGMDYGVDGVLQTLLGDLSAYQVKFRTGREPMTWRELSTFMGLADSPHIRSRILITNCDELSPVLNDRQGFFCIRGSDLDRMEVSDLQAIEAWLAEAAIQAPKKKPLPHQEEALAAIVPTLQKESRATAIMACGTGKTLVTLWTAEQLGARKILVLLPSLALLRQTLHEWLKETSLDPLAYLCVCSDPTVKGDVDEISTAQSDLDFEVSTDAATVRRFLDATFKGTKVIFSTYQSAAVVGEAMKKGDSFDLGIFDEAHKTAGREGRNYGFALEDKNISIRKRLFVTATPRHYNPSKRTKEGEATIAFSMDEPKVYGPQSYVLSFGQAARRKIICGYKVIISVITSEQLEEVTNEVLSKGTVAVKVDEIRARQVANQIALRDAVAQYGVSKVFTFHSTVKSAASFVAEGNEGVRTHLPEFSSLHVSGAMPTARRERVMKEFRSAPKAVMSNARCLTEGVDVPAVDMVAFLSPKKSKVDIVQAIGRAMRKSGSKEVGYVLIPLYLEQKAGESLEEAVARANFEEVWDILQSLQEQDEMLAELIREMSETKGRGKGFDDSQFGDRIEFTGTVLALESIRQSITTRVLERLESSWDMNFGRLVKFKEEHGHCEVPKRNSDGLGLWVSNQRQSMRMGLMTNSRRKRLDSVGFIWKSFSGDKTWFERFLDWQQIIQKYGIENIPDDYDDDSMLKVWVKSQRSQYKLGILDESKIRLLSDNGFIWNEKEKAWMSYYQDLCLIYSNNSIKLPATISAWATEQRKAYKKGILSEERKHLLEKINFEWDPFDSLWMRMFAEYKNSLLIKKDAFNHNQNKKLTKWIYLQRRKRNCGKLSQKKISLLNNAGFDWGYEITLWESRYHELVEFKNKFGNIDIPNSSEYRKLKTWVATQRAWKKSGKLNIKRISLLNNIGFVWEEFSGDRLWEQYFEDLKNYKSKFGNCNVPESSSDYKTLGGWVKHQRQNFKKGKLSNKQIELLQSIEFSWNPLEDAWFEMYSNLVRFHQKFGHSDVSRNLSGYEKLSQWVAVQRRFRQKGKLSENRTHLLDNLSFVWLKRSS